MLIAVVNAKGGVGKSTIAVHLAVWLQEQGRRVLLVDADVQGSSSIWLGEAAPEIPVARLQTADDILDQLPKLSPAVDDVVIDGPGGLSEVSRSILFVADYALLPCGPSIVDLRAASDAIRVLRQAQAIRKGPPEAVRISRMASARRPARRHWCAPLCSESTGSSSVPLAAAAAITSSPLATRTSLLASPTVLPTFTA